MELKKTIAIELDEDEYTTLMDASFLIAKIAKSIQKQHATGITCDIGSNREKHYEERDVWDIASTIEDISNVHYMYSEKWKIEMTEED